MHAAGVPAYAGTAPAKNVPVDRAPVKPHLNASEHSPLLPKRLTFGSCRPSPAVPEPSHRAVPQALTDASGRRLPLVFTTRRQVRPGKPHRAIPKTLTFGSCISSPAVPVSTHPLAWQMPDATLLKKLTFWDRSRSRAPECRRERYRGTTSVARSRRAIPMMRREANRHARPLPLQGNRTALARTGPRIRLAPSPRTHSGCSFILNPTTPGSSVADTSKPHDFASAIIGAFSRSASPIIHAVPRDRA